MLGLFCFGKEVKSMKIEEFKQLLRESGLSDEFGLKIDQLIRVINDHERRLKSLEARIVMLTNKN